MPRYIKYLLVQSLPSTLEDQNYGNLGNITVSSECYVRPTAHRGSRAWKFPRYRSCRIFKEAKRALARSLVELVWSEGEIPQSFDIEYEGADWDVTVRIKQTEDTPLRNDNDFMANLPE